MPLTLLNPGEKARVKRLTGNDKIKKHLNNLGLVEGKEVKSYAFDGTNYILIVDGARYALGKDLAKRIFVEEIKE